MPTVRPDSPGGRCNRWDGLLRAAHANHIPTGALLLVSDQPMTPDGVKTEQSDRKVTSNYVQEHVEIGIEALRMIIEEKKTVKHLKYEW